MRLLLIFATLTLLGPIHGYAGVMSSLSRGAYFIGTGGKGCDRFDDANAQSEVEKVAKMCSNGLASAKGDVSRAKNRLDDVARWRGDTSKEKIFYMLGALHSAELSCLSQYSSDLIAQNDSKESLKVKIRALREVTQILSKETVELAQDTSIMAKVCPVSSQQLEQDFGHRKDAFYEKCKKIITARNARKVILASIELSDLPPVKNFLEKYSKLPENEFKREFRNDLALDRGVENSYRAASTLLTQESNDLLDKANYRNSSDRNLWKGFLSDKKMMKSLLEASNNNDFRGAVCRNEASYGKGRDYLDNGLLVGSLVLTGGAGGLARVGGSAALNAMKVASGARSAGLLSRGSMASLQIALGTAAAGTNMTTLYSQLDKACFSESPNYLIDSSSPVPTRTIQSIPESKECACTDAVNAKAVKTNDCLLTAALGVVGLPILFPTGSVQGLKGIGKYLGKVPEKVIDNVMVSHDVGQIMAQPYRQLAQAGSVHVVGRALSSKKLGQEVAKRVSGFDDFMKGRGFRIPDSTRVIMGDRPLMPSLTGPFSLSGRVFNIRDFRLPENTIAMNPILYRTSAAKDRSVLLHERTHGVLHATYADKAYVNANKTVQEAFADFMAGHYYGKPGIGVGAMKKDTALRDIRTGVATGSGSEANSINSISSFGANEYHDNSLLYSQVLWNIREKVGAKDMNGIIKPIMDDLNFHRGSVSIPGKAKSVALERNNFAYYLASVRKTLQERGVTEAVAVVDGYATSNIMTARVNHYASKLSRSGDFAIPPGQHRGQTVLIHGMGAGAVATEGYLLYNYFK